MMTILRNRGILRRVVLLWNISSVVMSFFFFQAEDGIRDHCVTGVQTCALPICQRLSASFDAGDLDTAVTAAKEALKRWPTSVPLYRHLGRAQREMGRLDLAIAEIGRASCRERG